MARFLEDWPSQAACKDDPDKMFVSGAEQHIAKRVCGLCVVRLECLAEALDSRAEYGVWGGMTERQRRALLRRHADVSDWRSVLENRQDGRRSRDTYPRRQDIQPQAGAAALGGVGDLHSAEPVADHYEMNPRLPDPRQQTDTNT